MPTALRQITRLGFDEPKCWSMTSVLLSYDHSVIGWYQPAALDVHGNKLWPAVQAVW